MPQAKSSTSKAADHLNMRAGQHLAVLVTEGFRELFCVAMH